jgi:uncharacterized membrane protein
MFIHRAALKQNAKLDMRQARPNVYLFTLLYLVVTFILLTLSARVLYGGYGSLYFQDFWYDGEGGFFHHTYGHYLSNGFFSGVIVLLLELMVSVVSVGYCIYALNVSRHMQASYGNLLDGFAFFFKVIWLSILIGIKVFLWSLLFLIPGIIAALRYSQALFILIDHPELSAGNCIRMSCQLMQGHKGEYFILNLSFLGWALLSVIPFVMIYTQPYIVLTMANYYNALLGLYQPGAGGGNGYRTDPWEM